jgi:hypothetical protein
MSELYNTWKGKAKGAAKSAAPVMGMIYTGTRNKSKQNGMVVEGRLTEVYPDQGDAVLIDKENFPHCVAYSSLKIVVGLT